MRLPEQITPEWLTQVLQARGLIARGRVGSVEPELIGDFSNRLWRLHLIYEGAPGDKAPSTVILKHPRGDRDEDAQTFADEIRFYEELASEASVKTPALYFADSAQQLLGLEDVSNLEPVDFVRGATDEHARLAIDALAKLHAAFKSRISDIGWISSFADPRYRRELELEFGVSWPERRAVLAELAPDFVPLGDALGAGIADGLAPLGEDETLLHGDAHFENLALVRGAAAVPEVLFHDWAALRRGSPSFDVAVFIVMSLPTERRRAFERDLVARHDRILRGAKLARDTAWERYRCGVLAWAVRMVQFSRHARESAGLRLVVRRTACAAVDHRVDELARGARAS
jgi:hypothetical protein